MIDILLNDGKYHILAGERMENFRALRNGEEWRSLAGDNLVMFLCFEVQELKERLKTTQLDAFKAGMTEAANINCPIKLPDGMIDGTTEAYHWMNGAVGERTKQYYAIFTARDNKTTI